MVALLLSIVSCTASRAASASHPYTAITTSAYRSSRALRQQLGDTSTSSSATRASSLVSGALGRVWWVARVSPSGQRPSVRVLYSKLRLRGR